MTEKKIYNKTCVTCGRQFECANNKGMYCNNGQCKKKNISNRNLINRILIYEAEHSIINRKVDFLIQVLADKLQLKIPNELITPTNKLNVEDIIKSVLPDKPENYIEPKKIERKVPLPIKRKEKYYQDEELPEPYVSPIISQEKMRAISINEVELTNEIKKQAIETIKKNTGKFPIFTPQDTYKIEGLIERIKEILVIRNSEDINNKSVLDFFESRTRNIKEMIDEEYFK